MSWDAQNDFYTQQIRFSQVPVGGSSGVSPFWQSRDVAEGDNKYSLTGLRDGSTYKIQVRNITATGREGAWMPDPAYEAAVVFNSTAPAAHVAFAATVDDSDVDLSFTAPNDPNYYATRIYRAQGSTDFAAASEIHIEYGVSNSADAYTDEAPGVGQFNYWIEPINSSGISNAANRSGPQTVTIT